MPTTRILDTDHKLLQELSHKTGKQHQEIIHEALDWYQRDHALDEINASFERLRNDPQAWQEELAERKQWEATLSDGIDAK